MPKLKREGGEERATDFVESLDRGLRLLQAFGQSTSPMTLSDVARAADLPRATARRILFTLERGGFVASDGKLFTLTPHVLTLAGACLRSNQVVTVLQPVLDRIATTAQEISSLALLGQFDDDDLAKRLKAMKREPMTPQTVTDPKLLLKSIQADRAKGYSLVDREAEAHFRSISVPVRRYDNTIVAAINMGAHVDRVPARELVERFLPLLREGADEVKDKLL